ncbi:RNA polymerase sigma factor [Mucilaginibacter terrae]|uniref:RNA polymerase sigma factor n=1 Tax=Mucilaginibacter terrae TaxID=1955052 RepID=UPI003630D7B1
MYQQLTDEALIALLAKGDDLSLKTLFDRHYKSLCQLSEVYTKDYTIAEEIVANLFMKLWDNRANAVILNVKSYLFISTKNLSLNYLQKKKAPVDSIEDIEFETHTIPDRVTPLHILTGRESYNKLIAVVDQLPASQREVLLMSHVDNINKYEVAKTLGISVRTVESTLYQTVKKLRIILKDSYRYN